MTGSFVGRHRTGVVFAFLVGVCLILIISSSGVESVAPHRIGRSLFGLFQRVIGGTVRWTVQTFNSIGELREAQEELTVLRRRLQEAERISQDIVRLRRENAQLRELLGLEGEIGYRNIAAEVIGKQPGNSGSVIFLNKGERDGVRRFMPVVGQRSGTTGLVGKVVSVGPRTCGVLTLTAETSYVAARLESSRHDGLLEGQGAEVPLLLMRNVTKVAVDEITYGDRVVTSGLGQLFPKDIYIGRVQTVQAPAHEPSLRLEVEPLIDVSRLESVMVLAPDVP